MKAMVRVLDVARAPGEVLDRVYEVMARLPRRSGPGSAVPIARRGGGLPAPPARVRDARVLDRRVGRRLRRLRPARSGVRDADGAGRRPRAPEQAALWTWIRAARGRSAPGDNAQRPRADRRPRDGSRLAVRGCGRRDRQAARGRVPPAAPARGCCRSGARLRASELGRGCAGGAARLVRARPRGDQRRAERGGGGAGGLGRCSACARSRRRWSGATATRESPWRWTNRTRSSPLPSFVSPEHRARPRPRRTPPSFASIGGRGSAAGSKASRFGGCRRTGPTSRSVTTLNAEGNRADARPQRSARLQAGRRVDQLRARDVTRARASIERMGKVRYDGIAEWYDGWRPELTTGRAGRADAPARHRRRALPGRRLRDRRGDDGGGRARLVGRRRRRLRRAAGRRAGARARRGRGQRALAAVRGRVLRRRDLGLDAHRRRRLPGRRGRGRARAPARSAVRLHRRPSLLRRAAFALRAREGHAGVPSRLPAEQALRRQRARASATRKACARASTRDTSRWRTSSPPSRPRACGSTASRSSSDRDYPYLVALRARR